MTLDYITLTPQELGKLLAAGNGEAALVYLYIRATRDKTLQNAERELRIPADNLAWAESLLKRLGLLDIPVQTLRYDRSRSPNYTAEQISEFAAKDPTFALLQGEVSRRLGRVLTGEELKTLLSFRDYLKMPPEVVSMALTHCLQKNEYYNRVNGKQRSLTMRMLEKECYDWANRGVVTLEQASAYISQDLKTQAPEGQVKRALGLDRALSDSEREYIQSWIKMGFPVDTIKIAYDKTVMATGKLAWRYMNKILLNWHEKNLHSPQEVSEEKRRQLEQPADSSGFTPGAGERAAVSNLQKFRDSLKE